jgi:hypothetical protein
MFKKLALMILFFVSNTYTTNTEKVSWTKKIKHSPALVKVFAAIVPCIVTFAAMSKIMVNYKDSETIVNIAYFVKWTAASIASIFGNLLMKVNLKKWLKRNQSKYKALKIPDPVLVQT